MEREDDEAMMNPFAKRLENVILSYEHGGRPPESVTVELLRIMAEVLIDVHERLDRVAGAR